MQQEQQHQEEERVSVSDTPGAAVLEVVREGHQLGHLVIELQRHQECVFGRLPSCGVPLDHLSISRQHARLTTDAIGALFLTDLGSGACDERVGGGGARTTAPPPPTLTDIMAVAAATVSISCPWMLLLLLAGHGTNLDEMWVKPRVPKELRRGSVFKLGASTRQYRVVQLPAPAAGARR